MSVLTKTDRGVCWVAVGQGDGKELSEEGWRESSQGEEEALRQERTW